MQNGPFIKLSSATDRQGSRSLAACNLGRFGTEGVGTGTLLYLSFVQVDITFPEKAKFAPNFFFLSLLLLLLVPSYFHLLEALLIWQTLLAPALSGLVLASLHTQAPMTFLQPPGSPHSTWAP